MEGRELPEGFGMTNVGIWKIFWNVFVLKNKNAYMTITRYFVPDSNQVDHMYTSFSFCFDFLH